jgi:gliding motility-associated-like protein
VTVTDNCETPQSSDSLVVNWYDLPLVDFGSNTSSGCFPEEIYFYNSTNTAQVASCNWDLGNGFTSTNTDTVVNSYNVPGIYDISLEVISPNGCINDTTYFGFIEIYDYPEANFVSEPNPVSILTPQVQFYDSSTSDVVLFQWSFFDSTNFLIGTSNEQNPNYVFSDEIEQNYPVELYVENQYGCSDTVYGIQVILGEYSFYMPNSFTPNGDGLNDSFYPIADKIDESGYQFQVFNRWGEVVFSTKDINDSWDGKFKGSDVMVDAYLWVINLKDIQTAESKEIRGYVLLSR